MEKEEKNSIINYKKINKINKLEFLWVSFLFFKYIFDLFNCFVPSSLTSIK